MVTVEMAENVSSFRACLNIKSRANPDIQCHLSATHGYYCSRHYKNPKPFHKPPANNYALYTRKHINAAKKIQKFWHTHISFYRYLTQGPAINDISIAINDKELLSMDPISSVPKHYLITFSDERKCIWAFDIRTLVHSMASGFPSENPYNRDKIIEPAKSLIYKRIAWLRRCHYPVVHIDTEVLTPEQCWNHKVLDIFLKIESLGYYVNCDWYHNLDINQHIEFYKTFVVLWEYRLGLTRTDKERIVPGNEDNLFRFHPSEIPNKSFHWWKKYTLSIMEAFINRAEDTEHQKMGAMYLLMAFVRVSRDAAEALPWLV